MNPQLVALFVIGLAATATFGATTTFVATTG
jgi:hypothetical protein